MAFTRLTIEHEPPDAAHELLPELDSKTCKVQPSRSCSDVFLAESEIFDESRSRCPKPSGQWTSRQRLAERAGETQRIVIWQDPVPAKFGKPNDVGPDTAGSQSDARVAKVPLEFEHCAGHAPGCAEFPMHAQIMKKLDMLHELMQVEAGRLDDIQKSLAGHVECGARQPPVGNNRKRSFIARPSQKVQRGSHANPYAMRTMGTAEAENLAGLGEFIEEQDATSVISMLRELLSNRESQKLILDTIMGFVTVANCLLIGVSLDVGQRAHWSIVEFVFACLFSFEVAYSIVFFGWKSFFLGHERRWNLFALALVLVAWGELILERIGTYVADQASFVHAFRGLRLLRIVRLGRIVRLQIFYDLKVMVMGVLGGMRTLLWSAMLIFWPLYIASLVFRETIGEADGEAAMYFADIPSAMFTLSRCILVGDCAGRAGRPLLVISADDYGWASATLLGGVHVFITICLFNVITALYVENVVAAAKSDDVVNKRNRLRDARYFDTKMYALIDHVWAVCKQKQGNVMKQQGEPESNDMEHPAIVAKKRMSNVKITQEVFDEVMRLPEARKILEELDVADDDQFDLFSVLDADQSGTIDLRELRDGISRLRGDARRGDVVAVRVLIEEVLDAVRCFEGDFPKRPPRQTWSSSPMQSGSPPSVSAASVLN